ncbi:MAG: CRISPR-associated endonuclease Cas2 [Sporolactobacillus sp.]|jgi:CRISPR-associated protein Cas2|nr:CRISPR-associated endonuclease Cas2 [Sporolactobacillus sp.]
MMIVITYDVSTTTEEGRKRLRRVAKICQDYGQRVQNSVFECIVDSTQFAELKIKLLGVINKELDSLRFYKLGKSYKNKIEHVGAKPSLDLEGPLLF